MLQLLCSTTGNRKFRRKSEQTIVTKWTPYSVHTEPKRDEFAFASEHSSFSESFFNSNSRMLGVGSTGRRTDNDGQDGSSPGASRSHRRGSKGGRSRLGHRRSRGRIQHYFLIAYCFYSYCLLLLLLLLTAVTAQTI